MTLPQEVHDALTSAGGKNLLGQPIYKFAWSGTETRLISNGREYEEFRICQEDCWLLMKWDAPGSEQIGTQEEWERNNWEPSGLFTAGPYPRAGRYRVLNKLLKAEVRDNVLSWVPFTPDRRFVEDVFPGILAFQQLDTEQKCTFIANREKAEKEALLKKMGDSRKDYRGAASSKQIQDRVESLERYMGDQEWQQRVLNQTSSGKGADHGTDVAL